MKTVCHRENTFLVAVQVLIKAMVRTLDQLSCVSWVSLHRCLLIMPLAFSTSEDWGLQELCKWYSIPRIFDNSWVMEALKTEHCLLWTLEFKIPLTSWEVSPVKFHPLVNFWALWISKTIITITVNVAIAWFSSVTNSDPMGKLKVRPAREQFKET